MLDPICTVKDRAKQKMAPKTMVRFCRGDPVLVTGDINGEVDVYRLNRTFSFYLGEQTTLDSTEQRHKLT